MKDLHRIVAGCFIFILGAGDLSHAQTIEEKLRTATSTLEQDLRHSVSQLTEIRLNANQRPVTDELLVYASSVTDLDKRGYRVEDVAHITLSTKQKLITSLGDPELAGMRAYVNEFFPTANVDVISTEAGVLASPQSTRRSLDTIWLFLDRLKRIPRLSIDLHITSLPDEAAVTMSPAGGGLVSESKTNASIANQYRGYYRYQVAKAGYKTIQGFLNLVDTDLQKLECILHPVDNAAGPTPCALK